MKVTLALAFILGCTTSSTPSELPSSYKTTYRQTRDCRLSIEHDLMHIKVLADGAAYAPYMNRMDPFPTDSLVVKEQYGQDDDTCTGAIQFYTVMKKLPIGTDAAAQDWTWQKVDTSFNTIDTNIKSCTNCHANCGHAPDGYDGTCTVSP